MTTNFYHDFRNEFPDMEIVCYAPGGNEIYARITFKSDKTIITLDVTMEQFEKLGLDTKKLSQS